MEQRIKVNKGRILTYNTYEDQLEKKKTLSEYFAYDIDAIKNYNLSQSTDYEFYAWTDLDTNDSISFTFDADHPIYFPLLHLLGSDSKLIIDDDMTREINERYVKIYKVEDRIIMTFVNTKEENYDLPKFKVFVENICYDTASKIDLAKLDTKKRLKKFFLEVEKTLNEKNHQITLEEYMLKKKVLKK